MAVFWVILRARPFCLFFTTLYTTCMCASVLMFENKITYIFLCGFVRCAWCGMARRGAARHTVIFFGTPQFNTFVTRFQFHFNYRHGKVYRLSSPNRKTSHSNENTSFACRSKADDVIHSVHFDSKQNKLQIVM